MKSVYVYWNYHDCFGWRLSESAGYGSTGRVESDSDDMKTVLLNKARFPWEKMTDGFEVAVKNAVSVLPSSCATSGYLSCATHLLL